MCSYGYGPMCLRMARIAKNYGRRFLEMSAWLGATKDRHQFPAMAGGKLCRFFDVLALICVGFLL